MKLSWLIELIDMNASRAIPPRAPQCLLMGSLAYEDLKYAMVSYYIQMDPEKRDPDELRPPYRISGVPIYLDNGLPDLGIRVLRNDGSSYQVVGTYRP